MRRHSLAFICLIMLAVTLPGKPAAAASPAPAGTPSPFGLVTTLANRVREDELPAATQLLKESGVQWAREEIFWDRVQPRRGGSFVWSGPGGGMYNYDAAFQNIHDAQINILGLLDYNPAWFKSQNPPLDAWINDWGNYVFNTVARYGRDRRQIKHWEIWNEENSRSFGYENGLYSVEDYVRILQVSRAAIKAADPEATIVLGGVASIWADTPREYDYGVQDYLQRIYDAGGWGFFDIVALHPYRPTAPEASGWGKNTGPTIETELTMVDEMVKRLGPKPIWITEIGWSSYDGPEGVSEVEQAALMVRLYVLALAHPSIQRIFWYDFRDDTSPATLYHTPVYDPHEAEYHFGLLRRVFPLSPARPDIRKPAFHFYRTMSDVLGGLSMTGMIFAGNDPSLANTWGYRFDGLGRGAVVMWRTGTGPAPTIRIPCGCKTAVVRSADGTTAGILDAYGTIQVQLVMIGTPLYVEWGQDRQRSGLTYPQTGHTIAAPFIDYWQANGGLAQFGYPITGQVIEPDGETGVGKVVQYFERNRMEYNPAKRGTPFSVQIGRLGDDFLRRKGVNWASLPKVADAPPDCTLFNDTGHRLCPPFKQYWETRGGLPIYGFPLTDAFDEDGHTVQYFERARLEYHPDKAGTPFEIELGLLGRDLFNKGSMWP
ncbi:MAG: hypothetical protein NVSMB42_07000 [Herpetosiphon sp.]